MKKLIVYLTIFSFLFTSCATMHTVKPNKNSTKLFSLIEESAKDRKTTVELVNGKFYHTTNLRFKDEFLAFVGVDTSKIEEIKLEEIHRIVIEKEEISSWETLAVWGVFGGIMSGIFAAASYEGEDENEIVDNRFAFGLLFIASMTITIVGGLIHVLVEKSNNRIIYNFSPKALR